MKVMKKKVLILLLFFTVFFGFSEENNTKNELEKQAQDNTYYQLDTKYFEIIYQKSSSYTAQLIYENADKFYEEIASKFDVDTYLKMPVYIRSNYQGLNAYYSFYPYDHIVIYDAVIDTPTLAVFSETILSVFYHELTHAVSLKCGYDPINIPFFPYIKLPKTVLTSPTSFSEGATVSFESANGEGRLNSGYNLSVVLQAKLEDSFPDWKEASGANDNYRIGDLPYIFGGAFHQYLQKKYGMEKYSDFWKELNDRIFTEIAFKKTYNVKLKDEWELFKQSIPLLEVETNGGNINLSREDNINVFDATDNLVIYASSNDSAIYQIKNGKTTKILNGYSIKNLEISPDEKYLAITKLTDLNTYATFVYDLEKKKYTNNTFNYLRNPIFTTFNGEKVIVGLSSKQNKQTIQYFYLDEDKTLEVNQNSEPTWQYFTDIEILDIAESKKENAISILAKNKENWFVADVQLKKIDKEISVEDAKKLPDYIIPLSIEKNNEDEILISYVEKGYSLSRGAKIIGEEIFFQEKDISGGVLNPIQTKNGYVYLSKMFKTSTVAFIQELPGGYSEATKLEPFTENINTALTTNINALKSPETYKTVYDNSFKYRNIFHLDKTVIIPLLSTLDLSPTNLLSYGTSFPLPGLNIIWQNPLETTSVGFGGGYLAMGGLLNGHVSLSLYGQNFVVGGCWINKYTGFELINLDLSAAFNLEMVMPKNNSKLNFSAKYLWTYDTNFDLYFTQSYIIQYSKLRGYLGLAFSTYKLHELGTYSTPSILAGFIIPKLLPFNNPWGYTLNLPLTMNFGLCPNLENFIFGEANLTLFSKEIQQSIPLIPLYVNRFGIDCGYFLSFQNKEINTFSIKNFTNKITDLMNQTNLSHGITTSVYFDLTPVIGFLVNTKPRFSVDLTYYLDSSNINREKPYEITIAGMFTF